MYGKKASKEDRTESFKTKETERNNKKQFITQKLEKKKDDTDHEVRTAF